MTIAPILFVAGICFLFYLLAPLLARRSSPPWDYGKRGSIAEFISALASTATACFAFYAFFLSPVSEHVIDGMRNDLLFERKKIEISSRVVFELVDAWPHSWKEEDESLQLWPIFLSRLEKVISRAGDADAYAAEVYKRFRIECWSLKERSIVKITKPVNGKIDQTAIQPDFGATAEGAWINGSFRDPATEMDQVRAALVKCLLDLSKK